MSEALIVDASVAIKWVYQEELSPQAVFVRQQRVLAAPSLMLAECANILWKKVGRGEMLADEAILSANALHGAGVEFVDAGELMIGATRIALQLNHPAYDCFYLELSRRRQAPLVTADDRLIRKLRQFPASEIPKAVMLREIAMAPQQATGVTTDHTR